MMDKIAFFYDLGYNMVKKAWSYDFLDPENMWEGMGDIKKDEKTIEKLIKAPGKVRYGYSPEMKRMIMEELSSMLPGRIDPKVVATMGGPEKFFDMAMPYIAKGDIEGLRRRAAKYVTKTYGSGRPGAFGAGSPVSSLARRAREIVEQKGRTIADLERALASRGEELAGTKEQFAKTLEELTDTKGQLARTTEELTGAKGQLAKTLEELTGTKEQLGTARGRFEKLRGFAAKQIPALRRSVRGWRRGALVGVPAALAVGGLGGYLAGKD